VRLGARQRSRPARHRTVEEIWYVTEGRGRLWRAAGADAAPVEISPGDAIVIPQGVRFQFQALARPLRFLCYTSPPWPGPAEAELLAEGGLGPPRLPPALNTEESRIERDPGEERSLRLGATLVVVYLVGVTAGALALTIELLQLAPARLEPVHPAAGLICVAAGTLGSGVSALVSAVERIARGWEFSVGSKWPPAAEGAEIGSALPTFDPDDHRDMFGLRLLSSFLMRPLLGAVMGFFVYAGISGGYLLGADALVPLKSYALAFLAALAGITAKTFLDRLREMFKVMLGGG